MLLMIAAVPYEFAGFRESIQCTIPGVRWSATATVQGGEAMLVANGAGRSAAASGARLALAECGVRALVSTGLAGALDPALEGGDIFLARTVIRGDQTYSGMLPRGMPYDLRCGSLLTVDEVVQSSREKRALARRGARAVDMEAASVAAVAAECGLPFFCIRGISDDATRDLPLDFNRALRPDGTFSRWSILGQAAGRVGSWPGLLRLGLDARRTVRSLACCLSRCEFRG